jgi:hypothetical protein
MAMPIDPLPAAPRVENVALAFTKHAVGSLADIRQFAFDYLLTAVRAATKEALAGAEKKEAVLRGLEFVVDSLVAGLSWSPWLLWLKPLLATLLKKEMLRAADTLIEAYLNHL